MLKPKHNTNNCNLFGGFSNLPQFSNISSFSSDGIIDTIKLKAKETAETISNTIKSTLDIGGVMVALINDGSQITKYSSRLVEATGYDLSPDEWRIALGYLDSNYNIASLKNCCERLIQERANNERLRKGQREREQIAILSKDLEQCIVKSVKILLKPVNTILSEQAIKESYNNLKSHFGVDFLELCKSAHKVLTPFFNKSSLNDDNETNGNPNARPVHSGDNGYLDITRKYILFINDNANDLIHNSQKVLALANQAQKLFIKQAEALAPYIELEDLNLAFPLETCFLVVVWCVMCYELMNTAYGDIAVDKQTLVLSSCNLFVVLTLTLLAREGLPQVIDGGISSTVSYITRIVYNSFHDVVKPVVDFGISFANIAFEKGGINCIITTHKTWNQILCKNIYKEEGHVIEMWKALNMLHTFRVADAFLSAIINNKTFCADCLIENLMKLSPIPHAGEENKLLNLFWSNPYNDNPIQTTNMYGIFFNYTNEINSIYHRKANNINDDIDDVLNTAASIFYEIQDLNQQIGKSDSAVFDHYLVYCIAGKLKDEYHRPCISNMSQPDFASKIFARISTNGSITLW